MASQHPTLGNVIEICIATRDHRQTIAELSSFGIGPWQIYTFDTRDNISNGTISNQPAHFRLRVAFAKLTSTIAYEVIEPLSPQNANADTEVEGDIFSSWLTARKNHSGIHHIAYDCGNIPWEERMQKFKNIGAEFVQGGTWHGKRGTCRFAWFRKASGGDVGTTSTFFETILFSSDWEDPVPDATM